MNQKYTGISTSSLTPSFALVGYKDPNIMKVKNSFGTDRLVIDKSGHIGINYPTDNTDIEHYKLSSNVICPEIKINNSIET